MSNVQDVRCSSCCMLGMWDVQDLPRSRCVMFGTRDFLGMWSVRDAGC